MLLSVNDVTRIALPYIAGKDAGEATLTLSKEKQDEEMLSFYGTPAAVLANQWEMLCTSEDPLLRLQNKEKSFTGFKSFLRAHFWLWARPRNTMIFAAAFREKSWQCYGHELWDWIERIAALLDEVVAWDDELSQAQCTYVATIDGVDFASWEVKHPEKTQDPQFWTYKYNRCGFRYMIAVSVYQNKIIGVYGPFRGAYPEIDIFREFVKSKATNKLVIADKGNKDKLDANDKMILALPNPAEHKDLQKFKARALSRHETVNGRMKKYESLAKLWSHGMEKHGLAVRAIVATIQCRMDEGSELFPVFVEGLMTDDRIVSV